jgi:hypothetical protein
MELGGLCTEDFKEKGRSRSLLLDMECYQHILVLRYVHMPWYNSILLLEQPKKRVSACKESKVINNPAYSDVHVVYLLKGGFVDPRTMDR